jgi:hypothetical protein
MAVNLSPYGGVGAQFLDNSGNVLTGGKIFTYAAGTTTNQVTYTTSAGNIPHSNPIILDASGRVPSGGEIWLTDGSAYKFILRDSNDVLIATYDNVTGINSNFIAFTNQQEIQTATAGQTVFNLATISYAPATNSLSVFVDGVNQYGPGAQYAYLETNSNTVTFVNGLHVGAEVKFTTSQLNSSGLQANAFQVSYTPPFTGSVGTNVGDKLAQTVSVEDFGAVGDGITDDTVAIQAALSSGATAVNLINSYFITAKLTMPSGVSLIGNGLDTKLIPDLPDPGGFYNATTAIEMGADCFVSDFTIETLVANRTTQETFTGENYFYDRTVMGITVASNCKLQNIKTVGMYLGYLGSGFSNVSMINCGVFETGWAAINFYNATQIEIIGGNYTKCGGFGGITLPSCKEFNVTGIYLFNPTSTGINPGGASTAGFNATKGTVTNCVVQAGDCINFELGAEDCTVAGNICLIDTILASSGVGIGFQTRAGGGQNKNITISGNTILRADGSTAASAGIVFRSVDAAVNVSGGTIVSNTITGTFIGIDLRSFSTGPILDSKVTNNTILANTGGIWIGNCNRVDVSDNNIKTNSLITISNYYGIRIFNPVQNSQFFRNITTGWGTHYFQEAVCTGTTIDWQKTIRNPDDSAAFTTLTVAGGVSPPLVIRTPMQYATATGAAPTITPTSQMGLLSLNATVNGDPASNQSSSVWMYMNTVAGAGTGYTNVGISVVKITGLKHDFAGAIVDCALVGSTLDDTITISPGGFNSFTIREIPL